jgi:hypothetical protein
MTAWDHLPNAAHIDQVISYLRSFTIASIPPLFSKQQEWNWLARESAWSVAQQAVRDALRHGARAAVIAQCQLVSRATMTRYDARRAIWDSVWDSVQDAILALIAYDHSVRYLTMTADQLRVWSALSDDPACVLLLPYVSLLENIKTQPIDPMLQSTHEQPRDTYE